MVMHFMIPHSPFIFRSDGTKPKKFESAFGVFEHKIKYIEQVRYSGTQIIKIVDSIRKKDKDALIILLSDQPVLKHQ